MSAYESLLDETVLKELFSVKKELNLPLPEVTQTYRIDSDSQNKIKEFIANPVFRRNFGGKSN